MASSNPQRFFAPEVVQTSEMDCGPATLKCLLEGFGIGVSYGRLREACQTDVDGTSIDTLEEVARQLGLQAEQMILPVDHLLIPAAAALPALVVTLLPNGAPHFIVVWRRHGQWVQIMDPASGRRWLPIQRFLSQVYSHSLPVAATDWRAWAGEAGFQMPLRARLSALGLTAPTIDPWIQEAAADPSWLALATLDAATRLCTAMVQAGALPRGDAVARLLTSLIEQSRTASPGALTAIIPASFWSVHPLLLPQAQPQTGDRQLVMRGAVIVRVTGKRQAVTQEGATATAAAPSLSPQLIAALTEGPARPEWELWRALRADGLLTPAALGLALGIAAAGVTLEAVLLRGLLNAGAQVGWIDQRLNLLVLVTLFAVAMLLLELPIAATTVRMGRQIETRLRIALLEKIPRLGDRYFHSRLLSDMTNRAHGLRTLRALPDLGARFLRTTFQLLLTAVGVILLAPTTALPALLVTVLAVAVVLLIQPLINEQSASVRTHAGALSRFYLDGLLGLIPLRTHSAAAALRREHESLLVEWVHTTLRFFHTTIFIQAGQALLGMIFAIWIVWHYLNSGGESGEVLLLLYWALNLPVLAQTLAELTQQYPDQRNRLLRLLEPLGAPEEEMGRQGDRETGRHENRGTARQVADGGQDQAMATAPTRQGQRGRKREKQRKGKTSAPAVDKTTQSPNLPVSSVPRRPGSLSPTGVALHFAQVTVSVGGRTILHDIDLTIQAGEHVAIVGASGAGKSSLVGLLLGWRQPATGGVLVDGEPLTGEQLLALRRVTAWVDPAVQIWNRSLMENLQYGAPAIDPTPVGPVLDLADLYGVVEKLPQGLQMALGEGGGLVSGGEGQRVRLGRALLRSGVRLAILDEPFRGLDRPQRRHLLTNARRHWQAATLLCITHDVGETLAFDRVLVLEQGRLVEDGAPAALAAQAHTRYHALLQAETTVRQGLWQGNQWRRLWLADGQLQETAPDR